MSSCCRAVPCEELFGPEWARRDMEAYLRDGLGTLERQMVEELAAELAVESPAGSPALSEARVLEIGGGVGAMQAELLKAGAASGEVIELVQAYAPFAARLARELGVDGSTRFRIHDLLAEPGAVEGADLVIMNRVVCCSADGLELTAAAAGLTRHALVLSFPRSNWFTRGVAAAQRALFRLLGRSYRAFVWPQAAIAAAATTSGLQVRSRGGGLVWRYLLLVRGVTA